MSHKEIFINKYGFGTIIENSKGLEVRVRGCLDTHKQTAKDVIAKNNLNLKVESVGSMAVIKSFLVTSL